MNKNHQMSIDNCICFVVAASNVRVLPNKQFDLYHQRRYSRRPHTNTHTQTHTHKYPNFTSTILYHCVSVAYHLIASNRYPSLISIIVTLPFIANAIFNNSINIIIELKSGNNLHFLCLWIFQLDARGKITIINTCQRHMLTI